MIKKTIAYSLLLAFSVLFAPREVFHAHDHDTSGIHSEAQFSENCFACDYTIPHATASKLFLELFLETPHVAEQEKIVCNYCDSYSSTNFLRGPPLV